MVGLAWPAIRHCHRLHADRLPLDEAGDALVEFAFAHVAHVHQAGVSCFSAVFAYQEVHQFAFSGEAVLFADDLQEGDGIGEVEVAEVEGLGGCFP